MARPSRTNVPRRGSSRLAASSTGWRADARVIALTEQINRTQRRAAEHVVDAIVQIGRRMAEVRQRLDHGDWETWVREAVPYTSRTVTNYTTLAAWSAERPRELERLAHLGPTKLYMLAGLTAQQRRRLTSGVLSLPDGGAKPIALLTVAELASVIGVERGLAIAPARPPIDRVLTKMRHRIAGLEAIADELMRRRREVDEAEALELRNELVELVDSIDRGFGL